MNSSSVASSPLAPVLDSIADSKVLTEQSVLPVVEQPLTQSSSLYFIDRAINDIESIISGLERDRVVLIDRNEDGVAKITQTLAQYQDIESVHVFSHGMDGRLALGNSELSAETMAAYEDDLLSWGSALAETGDLLFYGCQVAASDVGTAFVNRVSELTGADVAASVDLTGIGGDWVLEVATGQIESDVALDAIAQASFSDTLALLNNGDFEGGLADWFGFTGQERVSTAESFTGNGSLELPSANSGTGQFVDAQAGKTYQLSGYAKNLSDSYSGFGINFLDASYNLLERLESGAINSASWQRYNMSGAAPVGTEFIQVWSYHGGNNGSTFIDALELSTSGGEPPDVDTTPPTAQINVTDIVSEGDTSTEFTVTYSDNTALNPSSVDSNDVQVTGPNGFSQLATLVAVDANADNSALTATYQIKAPGGSWNEADNGLYTVAIQANEVTDTSNNAVTSIPTTFETNITSAPPTDETQLLENGGFETGLNGWTTFTGTESAVASGTFDGNGALRLSASDSGTLQLVDAVAGKDYQLSGYGKANTNDYLGFGFIFLDASFNVLDGGTGEQVTSTDWQRYEMGATSPNQTRYMQVWSYKSGASGNALLDALSLTTAGSPPPPPPPPPPTGEGPEISSNGGGATATVFVQENNNQVTTVVATGSNLTYSISGGADALAFDINAQTGALFFQSAPDYETPTDTDNNNRYAVDVVVTDGTGRTDSQSMTINVTNEVSVYLLGGQSNMVGLASNSNLPPALAAPYPAVQIWQVDSQNFSDLRPGFAGPSGNWAEFGPELAFGRGIDGFADEEVYLIKHAQGSTNLAEDWDPDGDNNTQYDIFVDRVSDALGYLDSQNVSYDVEGMLWMQGEFDAFVPEFANAYEANLTAFIEDMRSRYGADMKFAIGRLWDPFAVTVKNAQDAVAAADPLNFIVNTDDFDILPDGVHYSATGQLDLGNGFAEVLK
ncbi:MAG: DUF4347 domain-containing protein [Cyanobacteria bacterium P01_D01_bin.105]